MTDNFNRVIARISFCGGVTGEDAGAAPTGFSRGPEMENASVD